MSQPPETKPKLDDWLYQIRWLLYPINIGLTLALLVFLARFLYKVALLVLDLPNLLEADKAIDQALLITIVTLLDQAMICSLLIVTIMGGHQIYVRRFQEHLHNEGPFWLRKVDTIVLKVKMGLAFTGVSSVMILKDLVSVDVVPTEIWVAHISIHLVFMLTTLMTAVVWRLMHSKDKE
jgi:uncharacterized protein (TIGR00645 family)